MEKRKETERTNRKKTKMIADLSHNISIMMLNANDLNSSIKGKDKQSG